MHRRRRRPAGTAVAAVPTVPGRAQPPAGPIVIVYVRAVDSDAGSLTVARQLPLASGKDAAMAEDPPTFWLPLGQLTCMVRYVGPDQTTETCIAPVPVKPTLLERWAGGSMTP